MYSELALVGHHVLAYALCHTSTFQYCWLESSYPEVSTRRNLSRDGAECRKFEHRITIVYNSADFTGALMLAFLAARGVPAVLVAAAAASSIPASLLGANAAASLANRAGTMRSPHFTTARHASWATCPICTDALRYCLHSCAAPSPKVGVAQHMQANTCHKSFAFFAFFLGGRMKLGQNTCPCSSEARMY